MHPNLAALVGSRICHDLISPIGAIGNGVELLGLTHGADTPEMALIADSVQNANARIRLFRIAFGAAAPSQSVSQSEIQSILSDVARGGRNDYGWQIVGDQPRDLVRAALLTLLCFETALPVGGTMNIAQTDSTWHFSATASRINVNPALWGTLHGSDTDFTHTAAYVQFALLPAALAEAGRQLVFSATDTTLTAQF